MPHRQSIAPLRTSEKSALVGFDGRLGLLTAWSDGRELDLRLPARPSYGNGDTHVMTRMSVTRLAGFQQYLAILTRSRHELVVNARAAVFVGDTERERFIST